MAETTKITELGEVISTHLNAMMMMKTDSNEAMPFGMGILPSMEGMTQKNPSVKYNVVGPNPIVKTYMLHPIITNYCVG